MESLISIAFAVKLKNSKNYAYRLSIHETALFGRFLSPYFLEIRLESLFTQGKKSGARLVISNSVLNARTSVLEVKKKSNGKICRDKKT